MHNCSAIGHWAAEVVVGDLLCCYVPSHTKTLNSDSAERWQLQFSCRCHLKELRPPSAGRAKIRILLVFDPWRSAILLVAGDKSGQWTRWYRTAIPRAEQLYNDYLTERKKEMSL